MALTRAGAMVSTYFILLTCLFTPLGGSVRPTESSSDQDIPTKHNRRHDESQPASPTKGFKVGQMAVSPLSRGALLALSIVGGDPISNDIPSPGGEVVSSPERSGEARPVTPSRAKATGNNGEPSGNTPAKAAEAPSPAAEAPAPAAEAPAPAAPEKFTRSGRIRMNTLALTYLFNLICKSETEGIDEKHWKLGVRGQWGDLMFAALDKDGNKIITKEEFLANWDDAVAGTFAKMGEGGGNPIAQSNVTKWDAADYEKEFAQKAFLDLEDGKIDYSHFEEYLFCVMACHASDTMRHTEDSTPTKEEVEQRQKELYDFLSFLSGLHAWEMIEDAKSGAVHAVFAQAAAVVMMMALAWP